jgi:hypothetical protein
MNVIELNDETFIMYAIKNYDNPNCTGLTEFHDDVQRFKYLKRLFRKANRGELKERLILNHLVVLYNLFGAEAATRMLFYKIDNIDWPQLKTFLVFLNFMPENLVLADGSNMPSADIALVPALIDVLRKI